MSAKVAYDSNRLGQEVGVRTNLDVLNTQQKTAAQAFVTDGARVGDPGHNLTGVN